MYVMYFWYLYLKVRIYVFSVYLLHVILFYVKFKLYFVYLPDNRYHKYLFILAFFQILTNVDCQIYYIFTIDRFREYYCNYFNLCVKNCLPFSFIHNQYVNACVRVKYTSHAYYH